jgi:hypothetical protein
MRRGAALALVLIAAGCGGHSAQKSTQTTAAKPRPAVNVVIVSPTHHPKVNKPWPVTIRVTDAAGKPIPGTLWMRILFAGNPVGKVDNGHVYHFVGSWHERKGNQITWPPMSKGQPLEFQVIVHAKGKTVKRTWAIQVQ